MTIATNVMNAFINEQQNKLNSNLQYVFSKLNELSSNPFFYFLLDLTKQTNDILSMISNHQINSASSI